MSLETAYTAVKTELRQQLQGACGAFSFYYAARLLQHLAVSAPTPTAPRPVHPPKTRYATDRVAGLDLPGGTTATGMPDDSIRDRTKSLLLSAQGEIFTAMEMCSLVRSYLYTAVCNTAVNEAGKATFVGHHLAAGHPILVAYWATDTDNRPCTSDREAGAHWVVAIASDSGMLRVLDPGAPQAYKDFSQSLMFASNAAVDGMSYSKYYFKLTAQPIPWIKGTKKTYDTSIEATTDPTAEYDTSKGGRVQKLAHVMIAVS